VAYNLIVALALFCLGYAIAKGITTTILGEWQHWRGES
jgi:hypothetical protein